MLVDFEPLAPKADPACVVPPANVTLGNPDCKECSGSGRILCWDCDGTGHDEDHRHEDCPLCDGAGWLDCDCDATAYRAAIAAEATRLWQRDAGRGITTGAEETYIKFAVQALKESA